MNRLSVRLGKISSLVPFGARVCDIGTDHGYLAIELAKSGKAFSVIAADVNQKPLENAKKNIEKAEVQNIELRLCDGFADINSQEFDTAVIAGMGGEVIAGIIERGFDILKENKTLILQPTTSPEFLRRFLNLNGFSIIEELPVSENNKLYSVMSVTYSGDAKPLPEYKYYIGNLSPADSDGLKYIKKQQKRCYECMNSLKNIPDKSEEFERYQKLYKDITNYIKQGADNGI